MWSNNALRNTIINIMVFLVGINFWRIGQLILPFICLLLLIDNKFKFKVNDIKIFIILCLFAISFFIFSYKLGFYSVMGFTLPMAYYIGSNMKYSNKENVIKLAYLLALGMACHLIMNFTLDLYILGAQTFTRNFHLDLWFGTNVLPTTTAVNLILPISLIYYVIRYEQNKKIKLTAVILFVVIMIYEVCLGRRTPILMLAVAILISSLFDLVIFNKDNKMIKSVLKIILIILVVLILFVVLVNLNVFGLKDVLINIVLFRKFIAHGLDSERIDILISAIKNAPYYLWGGQELSNSIGLQIHDLWMDTYDYAGIVPFILLVIYSVYFLIRIFKTVVNKDIDTGFRVFVVSFIACVTLLMFLEPVMTGSTIFLLSSIMIGESIIRLNSQCYNEEERRID